MAHVRATRGSGQHQQGVLSGPSRSPLTAEGRRQAARHPLAADSRQPAAYAVRAPGGESWAEVFLRVREALQDLLAEPTVDVTVFAHGGAIRLAWCVLMGVDPATHMWRVAVDNTSVARFVIGGPQPRMIAWNDVAHLEGRPGDVDINPALRTSMREMGLMVA